MKDPKVEYVRAEIFRWSPPGTYDFVFFGFWLSHVPRGRFEPLWSLVRRALRPSGRAIFVDSLAAPAGTAQGQQIECDGIVERSLNDGRVFRIVKVFYETRQLAARLRELGWIAQVHGTPNFFIYGSAAPFEVPPTGCCGGREARRRSG